MFVGLALLTVSNTYADSEQAVWHYTVRPGDNLITLGRTHFINPGDWKIVQKINKVNNPYRMPVGMILRIPLDLVKYGPASAEVIFVSGDVAWEQSANHYETIKAGQVLGPGARLRTQANSKAVIRFADGSTTQMDSNALLVLDALSLYSGGAMVDTKLRLQKGQVETYANPEHQEGRRLQIITPSAVAAVRGTEFRVSADDDQTTQATLTGQVAVQASNQQILVDQGFGTQAKKGQAPSAPVPLLPAADTSQLAKDFKQLPVTFTLPDMAGASAWVAKVATDSEFNQISSEAEVQSNQLVFNELPDGAFFLSLRAKDKQGIAGYDATHRFILNARPYQPEYVLPEQGITLREAKPKLQWRHIDQANLYQLEIASDDTFEKPVLSKRLANEQYQLEEPLVPGQYYWRVMSIAKQQDGQLDIGPAITFSHFQYKAIPPKPDLSQLSVNVIANRAFITTVEPPQGMLYEVRLDNEFNQQKNVWHAAAVGGAFEFLLKEYGKQTLHIRHVDADGVKGPEAIYEFDANPEKNWFVY